ncbi:MAG: hypothetical protein PW788_09060 [Micavibrio sp.]|nr:hypothetical protein [Micavibrio sp.]
MARFRTFLAFTFIAAAIGVGYAMYDDMQGEATSPPAPNPPELVVPPQPPPANDADAPYVSKRGDAEVSSRALTAGEALLAKNLFGDMLDAGKVRVHFYADSDRNYASDVKPSDKNNIEVYGGDNFSDDYSRDANITRFGGLVYELTHLMQNQRGNHWQHGDVEGEEYPLDSRYIFQNYGFAQQRAIMEDYARRFLHEDRKTRYLPSQYGSDRSDTDPFLKALVEDAFPGAKNARINFSNIVTRDMTAGEAAIISGIFGREIDTSKVKVRNHPEEYSDVAGTVSDGGGADFWGKSQGAADYSKSDAWHLSIFVHEMTHVWQNQTNWSNTVMEAQVYRYPLEVKYKFNDFSIEQQAAMMEDYTSVYLRKAEPRWLEDVYGSDYRTKLPLLIKTVEDRFPGAKALRESYDQKQQVSQQAVIIRPKALRTALG